MKNTTNAFEFKTLAEFVEYFKDEDTCRQHFAAIRFQNGEFCPHCGHRVIYTFSGGKRYRCASCREDFTIKTGTVFGESKLPLKKWFIAIYLLTTTSKGISSVQLAKHVGVTQKTGWFMDHRIRKALKQNGGKLFGPVEVDETYVGGLAKNMHKDKRKHNGTGGVNKAIVMGLVERKGRVIAGVIPNTQAVTLHAQIDKHVERGAYVYTDAYGGYNGLAARFAHQTVDHKVCYGLGDVHTNGAESFWALFKRGYHGVYHQMSKKHLQKYVDEFVFRFNNRPSTMQEIFSDVVARVMETPHHPYKELIA
jgi:transposase-like protein